MEGRRMRYKFEDIAVNSTVKKKPTTADKDTYLGLEHLDSGNLAVARFGSEAAPIGEKLIMKKGDVLFGKRRAYQKKVAIAPFDGIFSAHGMVLRPQKAVIDSDFFPLFISSDYFLNAAIKISVGSLSPTINWRDLKELEFELPPLKEQTELAKILWATIEAKNAYQRLLLLTDQLVKSQFVEMFGDPVRNSKGWKVGSVKDMVSSGVLEKPLDGNHGEKHPKASDYVSDGIPFVMANNLIDGTIDYSSCFYITRERAEKLDKGFAKCDDVLITHKGTIGRTAIVDNSFDFIMLTPQVTYYRTKSGLNNIFLKAYFESDYFQDIMSQIASIGTTRAYIGITAQLKLPIMLPPLALQTHFADFTRAADKSKFALQRTLDELEATYKALLKEHLG
jgi:type I restriction enzyme S subunit